MVMFDYAFLFFCCFCHLTMPLVRRSACSCFATSNVLSDAAIGRVIPCENGRFRHWAYSECPSYPVHPVPVMLRHWMYSGCLEASGGRCVYCAKARPSSLRFSVMVRFGGQCWHACTSNDVFKTGHCHTHKHRAHLNHVCNRDSSLTRALYYVDVEGLH